LGNELILHIRIPDIQTIHPNPSERAKYASNELSGFAENEIEVLAKLTECNCSGVPRLISWMRVKQGKTMWVPGGYVVYILMEKLPGISPSDFFNEKKFSSEDRVEIRKAFRVAMRYVITFPLHVHRIQFSLYRV
jgi:serine/threonine protein kinase